MPAALAIHNTRSSMYFVQASVWAINCCSGVNEADQFIEIGVVVADQGVEILFFGLQGFANGLFQLLGVGRIGRRIEIVERRFDLLLHVGQRRAAFLQLQQRQLAFADGRLQERRYRRARR